MTLIHQRSLAIAVTTSSTPRYGQGLLAGEQSEMSSGGNGSSSTGEVPNAADRFAAESHHRRSNGSSITLT